MLDTCRQLEREGFEVTYLDPEPNGMVDLVKLEAALRDDTILVSIMHVNNEIGVIQDITAIGEMTRARGIIFHVDAAQSAGKVPIRITSYNVCYTKLLRRSWPPPCIWASRRTRGLRRT